MGMETLQKMADSAPLMTRKDAEARLVARAQEDPAFREALKRDPIGTIAEELGTPIPSTAGTSRIAQSSYVPIQTWHQASNRGNPSG